MLAEVYFRQLGLDFKLCIYDTDNKIIVIRGMQSANDESFKHH